VSASNNPSNAKTLVFMFCLSFVCALLLSLLASSLRPAQQEAEELDRSKQLLITAQIFNYEGNFQVKDPSSSNLEVPTYISAELNKEQTALVPTKNPKPATAQEIFSVYAARIAPMLVDNKGELHTFKSVDIDAKSYMQDNEKTGYADLPYKLVYQVKSNPNSKASQSNVDAYVIPVNGMGLWDKIYGYIAIANDGDHVLGTTWYWQKETAGLGANIASKEWQMLFPGKVIFQKDALGVTDYLHSPIGIFVVRGKVKDIYGNSPKAQSAVDGMSGATLTGNGVSQAYKESLTPYRKFFTNLHALEKKPS
jgi:Na+-transporting NADH:ubiquinone oxidoreductase subunit C